MFRLLLCLLLLVPLAASADMFNTPAPGAPLNNPVFNGSTNTATETAALVQISGSGTGAKVNLFSNTYGLGINSFELTSWTSGAWCARSGSVTGPIIACITANGQFQLKAATAPSVSSCGTGPTLSATAADSHGTITEGTSATGCTLTFQTAFGTAPDCIVTSPTGLALTSYTAGTGTLVLAHASASNAKFTYHCIQ